jgi:thiol-disulfide isomerase/thioredoxin
MFNRSNLIIVAVAIFGAALGLFASSRMGGYADKPVPPGVTVLKIGDTRADLELTDLEGKPRRLSEFDGKFVLLNFWATWCGPCREEMPLLDAIDDGEAVRDFLKQYPVRYPILLGSDEDDPSLRFGDTKSVLPYSVLIAPDGKLLAQRAGYFSQETLAHWLAPHLPPS